jgi:hypothetical protein
MTSMAHPRPTPTRRAIAPLLVVAALAGACGGDDPEPTATDATTADGGATTAAPATSGEADTADPSTTAAPEPEPTTTTTTAAPIPTAPTTAPSGVAVPPLSRRCANPGGFAVSFPEGWHTNDQPAPEPCVWFGPEPVVVPEFGTDALPAPVSFRIQTRDLSVPTTDAVLDERAGTVDGRPAVRREYRTTEDLLYPAGTRFTTWEVTLDPRSDGLDDVLVGAVFDQGLPPGGYEEAVAVLDAMVPTVAITR